MQRISRNELEYLVSGVDRPCVSLYFPIHGANEPVQPDRIHLKHLLTDAEGQLAARDVRPIAIRALLDPIREKAERWEPVAPGGTAVLLARDGELRSYRLEERTPPLAWCGDRFYLKPMFAAFDEHEEYYLLAVSQNRVALYVGRNDQLVEMPSERLPESMRKALALDRPEGMVQVHTGNPALRGKEGGVYYGQGGEGDVAKQELLEYFHAIDRGVSEVLADRTSPLLFAGVRYLFPIYREANSYRHLWPECIDGNPDRRDSAELLAEARALLAARWREQAEKDAAAVAAGLSGRLATDELPEILAAAMQGRVAAVFVASDVDAWGSCDDAGRVERHGERRPTSEDLLDRAAVETFRRKGKVYALKAGSIPGGTPAAAVLRYASEA